jgi:choline-sulfatase
MKNKFNRRDFLKLAATLPLTLNTPRLLKPFLTASLDEKPKNVIVVVFDAFSAKNVPFYGYERNTTPNMMRLSKRAIVYHNHYAGSNFTTPGTASLLTGTLPWTHRAFKFGGGILDPLVLHNIFHAFEDYYSIAYTHNSWANKILLQFQNDLDELIPRAQLFLSSYDAGINKLFGRDQDIASVGWARSMNAKDYGYAYSLFLSRFYESLTEYQIKNLEASFPLGFPTSSSDSGFIVEQAVDYISRRLISIPQPFIGYFHFLPPHKPYRPSKQFLNAFVRDGYTPPEKPMDDFLSKSAHENLQVERRFYDEFILYCDDEFERFYNALETSGILDNTWLVLTSDHGEMNERGVSGHGTHSLYEPLVRVPLMIFEPGREVGMDVYDNTSAVDLLPTLAHLTGHKIPEWTEGVVLPPFAKAPSRNIYAVRATENAQYAPLTVASVAHIKENYKLHYYFGYDKLQGVEMVKLFDVKSDPEEMTDLSKSKKSTADELLNQLKTKLAEVNKPYK